MFRTVLYGIGGALIGFFAGVLLVALVTPTPESTSPGTLGTLSSILFFGTIIVCAILGLVFARYRNSRDKNAGKIDYSNIPPPALAAIIIALWMEGVAFIGGIALAAALNSTSLTATELFVGSAFLLCLGAVCGVAHVRYLKLNLSLASTDRIALGACFLYLSGVVIVSWQAVLQNPLAVIGTILILLPAYLLVRYTIKRG